MDPIRPIGPPERDIEPVYRVERAHDEQEEREQKQRKPRPRSSPQPTADSPQNEGPVEGDDGHLHVDVRA